MDLREANVKKQLIRLWKDDSGQDATEYALLLVLIALGAIAVMSTLGSDQSRAIGGCSNSPT